MKVEFFYKTVNGISISSPSLFIVYYIVLLTYAAIAIILGRGAACNIICWMAPTMVIGESISRFFALPRLRIISNLSTCSECKLCDKACPNSVNVSEQVQSGEITSAECKKCMACVDHVQSRQ